MIFAGLPFLYAFLPAALILYFIMPGIKAKNLILTLLSLAFYAFGEPVWVVLLLISSAQDYIAGKVAGRNRGKPAAKAALITSLVINLGLLAGFKYFNFLMGNLGLLIHSEMPHSSLVMPIGISFYTFQTMSYTIDVYRGRAQVQKSFLDFLLFVSLFPQLVAGPILRYTDIAEQLKKRRHTIDAFASGLTRFIFGLGKKVLIANFCGATAESLLAAAKLPDAAAAAVWLGLLCYMYQIYFDFSGYSDMAIGLGRMFGFNYGENFNYPYISRSVTEFWRRWHISLGKFFRDYVYIPLGGNRRFQLRNIAVVWFLTGLWHGASMNFILWGMYYGVLLCIEKFIISKTPLYNKTIMMPVVWFVTLLGWALFYQTDFAALNEMLRAMFGVGHAWFSESAGILWKNNAILLIIAAIGSSPVLKRCANLIPEGGTKNMLTAAVCLLLLFLSTAALNADSYNPFLYFRF